MAILGPGCGGNTPRKDLVEDESGGITPVSDKPQIGFDTPVRAFSWYTLYLLKGGKKEDLPPTALLIRTFQLPRKKFIDLSKQQIEESKLKSTSGLPNAEDIKIPNQMGFPSEALKNFKPKNLITYFSSGDYGKRLIESSQTQDIDAFRKTIGFGQFREQGSGKEAAFIPSPVHFFDLEHTYVLQPVEAMARKAVDFLLDQMVEGERVPQLCKFPATVMNCKE